MPGAVRQMRDLIQVIAYRCNLSCKVFVTVGRAGFYDLSLESSPRKLFPAKARLLAFLVQPVIFLIIQMNDYDVISVSHQSS